MQKKLKIQPGIEEFTPENINPNSDLLGMIALVIAFMLFVLLLP
ncbi:MULTISPECIES: hypothetical protein [Vibrio harveyi group]|nr:hypothetical protein [Vibrio parahaemolyticus]MDF4514250.1 hypothetical protein [Vibrio parahaemolyticus]MDF4518714.1 hypothetical protein [Vibrio parahaemolyticus]MDF4537873.1 hypothetical protein [Vibrio parahaemolyticus]MDF4546475.1 hypothetical protein [Vibrio parahaemolyticus]